MTPDSTIPFYWSSNCLMFGGNEIKEYSHIHFETSLNRAAEAYNGAFMWNIM